MKKRKRTQGRTFGLGTRKGHYMAKEQEMISISMSIPAGKIA